jgi:hypothetical protein
MPNFDICSQATVPNVTLLYFTFNALYEKFKLKSTKICIMRKWINFINPWVGVTRKFWWFAGYLIFQIM